MTVEPGEHSGGRGRSMDHMQVSGPLGTPEAFLCFQD